MKCIEDEIPFEVPEGWAWTRLKNIFNVCSSKRVLQSEWKTAGIPFYRAREIVKLSDNGFVDNELFISEEHFVSLSRDYGVPQPGDLMVSGVGTIGKVYIVKSNDRFYYKDASVLCFENRTGAVHSEFARILLESSFIQAQMKDNSKGTTVDTITISTAMNYLCILPPTYEQERIVQAVQKALVHVEKLQMEKENLQTILSVAKSKILDLAIRGKLVPQDPNDEPASVLLERIRAEKEEMIKQGKIKRDKKESIIFRGDDNSYYRYKGEKEVCIDDDLPYKLPDGWIWAILPEVVLFQEGPGILKKDFRDEGIPLIRISGLQSDKVLLDGCNYLDPVMVENKWKHFKLELGDIILCTSASIGKASIVGPEAVGAIPYTGQIRFKMTQALIREYFLYFANLALLIHFSQSCKFLCNRISTISLHIQIINHADCLSLFLIDSNAFIFRVIIITKTTIEPHQLPSGHLHLNAQGNIL